MLSDLVELLTLNLMSQMGASLVYMSHVAFHTSSYIRVCQIGVMMLQYCMITYFPLNELASQRVSRVSTLVPGYHELGLFSVWFSLKTLNRPDAWCSVTSLKTFPTLCMQALFEHWKADVTYPHTDLKHIQWRRPLRWFLAFIIFRVKQRLSPVFHHSGFSGFLVLI